MEDLGSDLAAIEVSRNFSIDFNKTMIEGVIFLFFFFSKSCV